MNEKLRAYIENLFEDAPKTRKTIELKEEILQNLIDKYSDLIAEGKTEEAAYNIAIASVGDVNELIRELNKNSYNNQFQDEQQQRKKSAIFVAISVPLYIMSVIPVLLMQNIGGVIIMFSIIAVTTGLLIYNGMTKPKYNKIDDTLVEEFKQWKANSTEQNKIFKSLSGALWLITVALYIVISFTTGGWHITWIIFLIAGAVESILKALFDLKK